jgi:hypothetical protein
MTAMATESATFPELLDLLGFIEEERVSVCHQPVGGRFTVTVVSPADAGTVIEEVTEDANIWFGVNPIRSDVTGRGAEIEVTRLACLHSDLDIKPGGLPSFEVAEAVINDLSDILGVRPVAIVSSGHGLQPYWAVDPTDESGGWPPPSPTATAAKSTRSTTWPASCACRAPSTAKPNRSRSRPPSTWVPLSPSSASPKSSTR